MALSNATELNMVRSLCLRRKAAIMPTPDSQLSGTGSSHSNWHETPQQPKSYVISEDLFSLHFGMFPNFPLSLNPSCYNPCDSVVALPPEEDMSMLPVLQRNVLLSCRFLPFCLPQLGKGTCCIWLEFPSTA